MGHRLEKNMKIMEELVSFCTKRGARNIDTNLLFSKDCTEIKVSAENTIVSNEDLAILKNAINSDRQQEVEECFWYISGEDYLGDELTLAGVMINNGSVEYHDNKLVIYARRKED